MLPQVTTSDNEWQQVTTSGNEWQQLVQRVTTSDNRWHRMTGSDNEWQFWPNFLFSNNVVLVWAVLHFITPEVTADRSNTMKTHGKFLYDWRLNTILIFLIYKKIYILEFMIFEHIWASLLFWTKFDKKGLLKPCNHSCKKSSG